jgi:hypothetical protein
LLQISGISGLAIVTYAQQSAHWTKASGQIATPLIPTVGRQARRSNKMIDEVLRKLIDFLQEASPFVWSTLLRQVYVDAAGNIAWSVGLLVLAFVLYKAGKYGKEHATDYNMLGEMGLIAWFFCALFGVASFSLLVDAIKYFSNPEFYAIQYILRQIGGG